MKVEMRRGAFQAMLEEGWCGVGGEGWRRKRYSLHCLLNVLPLTPSSSLSTTLVETLTSGRVC